MDLSQKKLTTEDVRNTQWSDKIDDHGIIKEWKQNFDQKSSRQPQKNLHL